MECLLCKKQCYYKIKTRGVFSYHHQTHTERFCALKVDWMPEEKSVSVTNRSESILEPQLGLYPQPGGTSAAANKGTPRADGGGRVSVDKHFCQSCLVPHPSAEAF